MIDMDQASSVQTGIIVLQVATLVVQAFLTAFTAWLGFRSAEAKADREAQAKGIHAHLERQTGKLSQVIEEGKVFRP